MAKNDSGKCYGCETLVALSKSYFFVKAKGQPIRYYCEKCAKARGWKGADKK